MMPYDICIYLLLSVPEQFLVVYYVTSKFNKWNKLFREDKQILIGLTFIYCLFYFPVTDLNLHLQLILMIPFVFNVILMVNLMYIYYGISMMKTTGAMVEIYVVKTIMFSISLSALLLLDITIDTTNFLVSSWSIYFPMLLVYIYLKRKKSN